MFIHNHEQVLNHLNLAHSLIDTVIAALDHPDNLVSHQSVISCLELSGWHIQQLQREMQNSQTVILPETALLETVGG